MKRHQVVDSERKVTDNQYFNNEEGKLYKQAPGSLDNLLLYINPCFP